MRLKTITARGTWLAFLLVSSGVVTYGQVNDTRTYETAVVSDFQAQKLLAGMIPEHKKFATINPFVVGTDTRVVETGTSCSSSSSGTLSGTADDYGNVSGTTRSNGSTDCTKHDVGYYTIRLGLPDSADPKAIYIITAQCVEKWIWNHCAMPQKGQMYPVVLEEEKHGAFDVYAATTEKLGAKSKVATFAVLKIEHLEARQTSAAASDK
jgi:hypothetical protein